MIDYETFSDGMLRGAAECVQWQASDLSDEGNGYPITDGGDEHTEAVEEIIREDVLDFLRLALQECPAAFQCDRYTGASGGDMFGHDFILSANHHGTGFWDRGLGDIGDKLHELAGHSYGVDATFCLNEAGDLMFLDVGNNLVFGNYPEPPLPESEPIEQFRRTLGPIAQALADVARNLNDQDSLGEYVRGQVELIMNTIGYEDDGYFDRRRLTAYITHRSDKL